MASVQLMIGNKKSGLIGSLQLDATIEETHMYDSEVTGFPVEKGSNITDHILNLPIKLDMVGFVTNNPITIFGIRSDLTGRDIGNRVNLAFEEMIKIRDKKEPIEKIVTGLKTYENMALSSLSIPRTVGIGDTFRFKASFKEVQIVSTETVALPNLKEDVEDIGSGTSENGKLNAEEATEEQKEAVSLVQKLVYKLSGK